jgi:hypothetical protein
VLRPATAIVAFLVAVSLPAADAAAQDDPSASEVALAREQFRLGVSAAREERWEEARDAFQRSYELAPRPLTLLNLGGALVQTGMLVEGAEAYRRFLREVRTGRPARQRGAARTALEAAEARIARLRIYVTGVERGDVIRVDDEEISLSALELELPVNPGARVLTVERDGETVVRREVTLDEGERREVQRSRGSPRSSSRRSSGPERERPRWWW